MDDNISEGPLNFRCSNPGESSSYGSEVLPLFYSSIVWRQMIERHQ